MTDRVYGPDAVSRFAHLHVRSSHSYGEGVAHPHELARAAAGMGYGSLALCDRDGLYGIPAFMAACAEYGLSPIVGAEVTVRAYGVRGCGVVLCESPAGYAALAALIGHYRMTPMTAEEHPTTAERRFPVCPLELLLEHATEREGLVFLTGAIPHGLLAGLVERGKWGEAKGLLHTLREAFGPGNVFAELTDDRTRHSRRRLHRIHSLAVECGVPVVAANEVSYVDPADHRISETLWAAYSGTALPGPGHRPTDGLYLKDAGKIRRTFADVPEAVDNAARVAGRCAGAVGADVCGFARAISGAAGDSAGRFAPTYRSASGTLAVADRRRELLSLVLAGAKSRYRGRTDVSFRQVLRRLRRELSCVGALGYTSYFLLARQAREIAVSMGTPVTGRGSGANSLICYVLGLTQPDPFEHRLLFERFMNEYRTDAADIDLDLDSELRDPVRDELVSRYQPAGAAVAATAQTFSLRGATRAACRALGYSPAETDELARGVPARVRDPVANGRASSVWEQALREPSMRGSPLQDRERHALLLDLSERLAGRLQGAGTHLGGLVVGTDHHHLSEIVPMEPTGKPGLTRIQWDAWDLELLGIPKLDLLGLKTHTALRKAGELIGARTGEPFDPLFPPANDRETYRMIGEGRAVSTFQIESPGQLSLGRRLKPKRMEHLIAQVSLFRPGPLEADLLTPYLARKNGLEPYSVPVPELDPVLRPTYGVLVYQEQLIEMAQRVSGCSLAEADELRKAMKGRSEPGQMARLGGEFLHRAAERPDPVDPEKAREVFSWMRGFGRYGFSQAHAASFAGIVYATTYMKTHYPAEWLASCLNSQPMGCYSPRVLLGEARRLGLAILPPDIHLSDADCTVEDDGCAIRVGLSYCRGLSERAIEEIVDRRADRPFNSPQDLYRRTSVSRDALENLIEAGFLDPLAAGPTLSAGAVRQGLLDAAATLPAKPPSAKRGAAGSQAELPHPASSWESRHPESEVLKGMPFPPEEAHRRQRRILGLDVAGHPLSAYREALEELGVTPASEFTAFSGGRRARASGVVELLQRPPAKPGNRPVNFLLIEDESGLLQCTIFSEVFQRYGPLVYRCGALLLEGKIEQDSRRGFSFVVEKIGDLSKALAGGRKPAAVREETFVGNTPSAPTSASLRRRVRRTG